MGGDLKFQGEQKLFYPPGESADPDKGDTSVLLHHPSTSHAAGYPFRFKDHNSEMTQKDNRNARDLRQVEMLFPEFFSSGVSSSFIYQRNWREGNHRNNTSLVNEKIKEDPFIRPCLNLFGACSYT